MSAGGILISPAVLATLQNTLQSTLTPEGVLTQMDAERVRREAEMRRSVEAALGEAGAAQQAYQGAAAAPVPQVDPLEALVTRIGSSAASIVSGDKAYAERGVRSLDQMHTDLLRARMDNLTALKEGWDQKAAAARQLNNLEAEVNARAKSEQLAKTLDVMLQKQREAGAKERSDADNAAALARVRQQGANDLALERLRQSGKESEKGATTTAVLDNFTTEYVDSRGSRVKYLNQNKVPAIKDRNAAVVRARGAGVPVLTQKQEDGLHLLEEAFGNIEGIAASSIGVLNPETGEYEGGFLPDAKTNWNPKTARNVFAARFQTDAQVAAFPSYRTAAINIIQSLASLGPGLRINQAEINSALKYDIPNITDTRAVAQEKLKNLRTMLTHVEDSLLGRASAGKSGGKAGGSGASGGATSFEDEVRQAMEGR